MTKVKMKGGRGVGLAEGENEDVEEAEEQNE